jgi:pimeloyl-ACP methyl ester carboxylesterase
MEPLAFRLDGPGRDLPIVGDVRLPAGSEPVPVVAIAHGWLGWKDHGFLPYFAEGLAAAGLAAVSYSFSCSGVPAGADAIEDVDAFAKSTWSREVADQERIVTAIFERLLPGAARFDIYKIGAVGHDTGGAVALLEARRDSRVKAVVTIGAPARLDRVVPEEAREAFLARGEWRFRDPRTNRMLRLEPGILRDLRARAADLDVRAAAQELATRFLVIHGAEDRRVPLQEARSLFFSNSDQAEIEVLPGADHDLGATHPMGEPAEAVRIARAAMIRFLKERLA